MPLDASDLIALQRATHAVILALDAELRELGLSPSETNVVACLSPGEPRRIGEIIADTAQRPSTVTGILDRLERRGLVERRLAPDDRRSFRAALTTEGESVHAQVRAGYERVAARMQSTGFRAVLESIERVAEG
jgi:MarR family transcriptional regulator, organic hydroperoxide resistance regulator